MRLGYFSLLLLGFFSQQIWGQTLDVSKEERRFAFVMGINEYQDLKLPNLRNAINDALGITKILYQNGSFNSIKTLVQVDSAPNEKSLSKFNILRDFNLLLEEARPNDFLLFYFSGHGFVDYDEKAYLLPVDGDLTNPIESAISVEELIFLVRLKKLKKVVFVIDACRNPELSTQSQGKDWLKEVSFQNSDLTAVFYSTKLGYSSFEDESSAYGVFTRYLLSGMNGKADLNFNGEVSLNELTDYVNLSLKEWSQTNKRLQKPFTKYYGEKSEDVVLSYANNPESLTFDAPKFNPYNPTFAFRSFIFPGWGQYARGEQRKGLIFMGLFSGSFLFSLYQADRYLDSRERYSSAIGFPPGNRPQETLLANYFLLDPLRQTERKEFTNLEYSVGVLSLVWVWNIFDFYLSDPTKKPIAFFWDAKIQNLGSFGMERIVTFGYEFSLPPPH